MEQIQELLTGSVLAIIVETLSNDLTLRDLIKLTDTVGEDAVPCCGKLRVLRVVHIIQVINDKSHLLLVRDGSSKSLELELLDALRVSVTDGLNDSIQLFLLLR